MRTSIVLLVLLALAVGCGSSPREAPYPKEARAGFVNRCLETMSGSSGPADKFCNCFFDGLRQRLSYADYKRVVRPILEAGDVPDELQDERRDTDAECEPKAPGGPDY